MEETTVDVPVKLPWFKAIRQWTNILFKNKVLLVRDWNFQQWILNISWTISDSYIPYNWDDFVVNFPWEYEKDGIFIVSKEWIDWLLSYFVFDYNKNKSFAFVQDHSVFENLELERKIDIRTFENDEISQHLDKYWFEWERYNLQNIEEVEEQPWLTWLEGWVAGLNWWNEEPKIEESQEEGSPVETCRGASTWTVEEPNIEEAEEIEEEEEQKPHTKE